MHEWLTSGIQTLPKVIPKTYQFSLHAPQYYSKFSDKLLHIILCNECMTSESVAIRRDKCTNTQPTAVHLNTVAATDIDDFQRAVFKRLTPLCLPGTSIADTFILCHTSPSTCCSGVEHVECGCSLLKVTHLFELPWTQLWTLLRLRQFILSCRNRRRIIIFSHQERYWR